VTDFYAKKKSKLHPYNILSKNGWAKISPAPPDILILLHRIFLTPTPPRFNKGK
jgi:hypothetical protein